MRGCCPTARAWPARCSPRCPSACASRPSGGPERCTPPGLFTARGEVLLVREDVGDNAMDKVVGRALLDGRLALHDHILCVSGRLSFENSCRRRRRRAHRSSSASAPLTSLAIELAADRGMTLAGFARGDSVNVYCGGEEWGPRRPRFVDHSAGGTPALSASRSLSAASTASISAASSRPAETPNRWGSTTVVCCMSTRVGVPDSSIIGRNVAALAVVEVGALSMVLSPNRSSACTTIAYRTPRRSATPAPARGPAGETPRRGRDQRSANGELSRSRPRMARISSRSSASPATTNLVAYRGATAAAIRGLRSAARTACESFSPSARTTSSAAALASSSRTCRERAMT